MNYEVLLGCRYLYTAICSLLPRSHAEVIDSLLADFSTSKFATYQPPTHHLGNVLLNLSYYNL